jgi:hypothetical protein
VAGSPPVQSVSVPHSPSAIGDQFARAVFRFELSDPSRLVELRDFYVKVQAVAGINGKGLIVGLAGPPDANDERCLHAYLQTWLALAEASGRRRAPSSGRSKWVRAITSATWLVRMRPD